MPAFLSGLLSAVWLCRGVKRGLGQPFQQRAVEHVRVDWFGDMVVHTGHFACLAVFIKGVGGHGQNGGAFVVGQVANGTCGNQAIHHRHLHIHQDEVIGVGLRLAQSFCTVIRHIDAQSHFSQQLKRYFLIDRVVLNQ